MMFWSFVIIGIRVESTLPDLGWLSACMTFWSCCIIGIRVESILSDLGRLSVLVFCDVLGIHVESILPDIGRLSDLVILLVCCSHPALGFDLRVDGASIHEHETFV